MARVPAKEKAAAAPPASADEDSQEEEAESRLFHCSLCSKSFVTKV